MIDLHAHTTESDGTFTPKEIVETAIQAGVDTLAITDHDTFAGYDHAVQYVRGGSIRLICGIELSTKFDGKSVHLLGYFPNPDTTSSFRDWIRDLQASRYVRNLKLVARLAELGIPVTIPELKAGGMTGRPHFAKKLVELGVVSSMQQAFDEYLSESGKAYVERDEPSLIDTLGRIHRAGGVSSLAHPVRVKGDVENIIRGLRENGLDAIEAYHSDHSPQDTSRFLALAAELGMFVTGGSDFHGANKPGISLGTGRAGNVSVPESAVDWLNRDGQRPHDCQKN